jgi:hypothetical protein
MDTWMFFKWIFKTFIAIYLVTHTFDITIAVFDMAQHVVQASAGVISGSTNIDISSVTGNLQTQLSGMDVSALFGLWMESLLISFSIKILSVCIFLIIYGRMLEIYLLCSVGPIPFATMTNRELATSGFLDGIVQMTGSLVKTSATTKPDAGLFQTDREIIGVCPRCGKPVYEGKRNFYCSGYQDNPPLRLRFVEGRPLFCL